MIENSNANMGIQMALTRLNVDIPADKFHENGKPSELAMKLLGSKAFAVLGIASMFQHGVDPGPTADALRDTLHQEMGERTTAHRHNRKRSIEEHRSNQVPWSGRNAIVDNRLPNTRGMIGTRIFNQRQLHRGPGRYSSGNETRRLATQGTVFKSR